MKIFVLDSKAGKSLGIIIKNACLEKKINAKVLIKEKEIEKVPRSYNIYFLHLNDVLDKDYLNSLKKTHSKSYFIEIGVDGGYYRGNNSIQKEDNLIFSQEDIEEIIQLWLTK